jgi:hypothetical protein
MLTGFTVRREDYWHRISAFSRARHRILQETAQERIAAWARRQCRLGVLKALRPRIALASLSITGNNQYFWFLSVHPVTRRGLEDAYYAQLRAIVTALRGAGAAPKEIRAFLSANASPDWTHVRIKGGNFHFTGASNFLSLMNGSRHKRCDMGRLGTLDFSHGRDSVHLDAANPYNFPVGTFKHLILDIIIGNCWQAIIPRKRLAQTQLA